ncbi:hypothetical protein CZ771_00885 [Actinomycetales bacterium JB111]|nr:hypothetical protein CZ771_00885 [Actinomycetales bacterium JB111]
MVAVRHRPRRNGVSETNGRRVAAGATGRGLRQFYRRSAAPAARTRTWR